LNLLRPKRKKQEIIVTDNLIEKPGMKLILGPIVEAEVSPDVVKHKEAKTKVDNKKHTTKVDVNALKVRRSARNKENK